MHKQEGTPHAPILMEPSNEDLYEGRDVVKCTCQRHDKPRLARDCPSCCEKCPQCQMHRKFVLAFEYLPFGPRIAQMCKSKTNCFEFLELWRQRDSWLGKAEDYKPSNISQFWHGKKMREFQDFWNPDGQWELPVQCSSRQCTSMFRAFPTRCNELQNGWKPELERYQFQCPHCHTPIDVPPSYIQVSYYGAIFIKLK